MMPMLPETPSQTAGPFVHIGLTPGLHGTGGMLPLAAPEAPGAPVALCGTLTDAEGVPVTDALIEGWQAGGGWARCSTHEDGGWRFDIARPDAVPFVGLYVVARGINLGLHTRLYFPDADWRADPAMARVSEARRATLVASDGGDGAYRLDIRLGGPRETVFFDV